MKRKETIKTTGELRDFLAAMMVGVKNGDFDLDKARMVAKLAGQINESFYAEVKVAKVLAEAGNTVSVRVGAGTTISELGAMCVGSSAT